uniref:C-type lectin domain-containing protein n=1 Tax=Chelonoidis abingdonii TaxID=106734 RepID=A0A8C0HB31_CHEAB
MQKRSAGSQPRCSERSLLALTSVGEILAPQKPGGIFPMLCPSVNLLSALKSRVAIALALGLHSGPWALEKKGLEQGAGSQDSWVLFLALPDSLLGPELDYSGFCFLDSVCGHCSWGWAWFQRTCYHFSESTKTWHEAKQFCSDYGAHLVIINTKEEQVNPQFLLDLRLENQWLWVDGSPLNLRYVDFWSTGEPNDSSDEDCGTMAIDGRWNDINCYWTDYWICEKPWLC